MEGIAKRTGMYTKALAITILVATFGVANAQYNHTWSFNPADFANSGSINAIVQLDGSEVSTGSLGAFVGSECRGIAEEPVFFGPTGKYLFDFLVYSNVSSGESLRFVYFDDSDSTYYDVAETIEFIADMTPDAFNPDILNAISNDPPTVASPIPNQTLDEYFGTHDIDLSGVFSDPDLDALTFTATSSSGSVVTTSVSGSTLTIIEEGLGTATITVTADDGLATVDDVFTVTVNNVNDAPVVANPIADISPNEGFGSTTINLSATFSDPDGDALTRTATSSDEAVVTVSISGTTLTITEVDPGSSLITVTASDGEYSVDETFTVTVNNVNDAPVVSSPIPDQGLDEYFGTLDIELGPVFTDPDGDDLTLTPVSSNPTVVTAGITGSTLTITEAGLGSSTITITASDGSLSVSDQFVVTVSNVNDAPTIVTPIPNQTLDEYFVTEEIDLTGRYNDKDGDPLTITASSSSPGVVTAAVSGNTLTITEVGLGAATITVNVSDGTLDVNDLFNVTVNNVNDAPEIDNPIPDEVREEHFISFTIDLTNVFSDKDADPLTLTPSSSNPGVVTAGISGNTLTITEVGLGTSTITVTASDGSLNVSDQFTVTVNNVNDAPVVSNPIADQSVNEGFSFTSLNLSTTFTDPDGDVLSLTATSGDESVVTVGISGSTLTITEAGLGTSLITVTASDGTLSVSEQFNFVVNNVNDPPVVDNPVSNQVLSEGFGTTTIDLTNVFSDEDGDPLTLSASSSNTGVVTVSVSGTTLTIIEQGLGVATVTVNATDGSLSVSDQFSVTVNNVNDPPVVVTPISDRNYDEGFGSASISLGPVFNDPDGDVLLYSAVSGNTSVVTVSINGSILTITEAGLGSSTILVSASDGFLNTSTSFTVNVNNVNDAPVVDNPVPNQAYNEYFGSSQINVENVFSDPDAGDVLTLSASSSDPSVVDVSLSGNTLTILETGLGTAVVTLTATDDGDGNLSTSDQFNVTVNNVNDAPEVDNAIADQVLDEYFTSLVINLSGVFSDKDGDDLTITASSSNPSVVTVSVSGTQLTITEQGLGAANVTVTASDGLLDVSDEFGVQVNNVNDAPEVDNPVLNQSYNEGFGSATVSLASVFSDRDGDDLTLSAISSNTSVVTVGLSGTTLTITEAGLGSAVITVTASDGSLSVDDQFNVTVNNVNDPPVVDNPIADRNLQEYFSSLTINIGNVFSDPDAGDQLTITVASSNNAVVTASISGNTLTLTEQGLGTATVTVTATDDGDGNLSVSDDFEVNVANVNDAPQVDNPIPNQDLQEYFATVDIDLTNVFSDKDLDPLTISAISSNTDVVTVSVSGNTLTITEAGLGNANITVSASDGSLSVDDQFTVVVNNVNDAPEVENPIADQEFNEYFSATNINLTNVFSDKDGDVITLSALSSDTDVVTVLVSGTNLIITEQGLGSSTITVTATDGTLSTSDQFLFTVNNVNDAPVVDAPISSRSVNEGFATETIDLGPVFSDPDGDGLTYAATSSNVNVVTVSVSGTTLTITEVGLGSSTITVTASDGTLSTDDQFNFAIDNVNDQPEILQPIGDRNYDEGFTSVTINLTTIFSDPDGDVLTFTAGSSNPSAVTVSVSGSILTITEQGLGSSTITVNATDGTLSNSDVFTATVNNVNDAPVLDNPLPNETYSEYFGTETVDLAGVFSDPDGDDLTLTAISSNSGVVTVAVSGTTLTITETGLGVSTITVNASDGTLSASDQFTVNVTNVNDSPEVLNPLPDRSYEEGFVSAGISLAATFTDKDGDVLSLTASSSDEDVVTVSISGSSLTITEVGNGTSTITVTASDGSLSVSEYFLVAVNNINDQPEVVSPISDRVLNEHFGTLDIDLAGVFSDPDAGDNLTLTVSVSDNNIVTAAISGTTLTLTEAGLGITTVTVTATDDGDGNLSVSDQFTVRVNNVNDQPVVDNPLADRNLDEYFGSVNIDLTGVFSDPDDDLLVITAVSSSPSVVTASVSGTTLTIQEQGLGTATVTVTASDGSLSVDEQFIVNVANVNDRPQVDNPISDRSYNEGFGSAAVNLASVFNDKDGDALTLTAISGNNGVVTVSLSGTTLTITETGLGSSTISVTASDGNLTITDQFLVTVNNVNDPPVVDNPIADRNLSEYFGSTSINLSSVFSDPDAGDQLTITAVSSNSSVVTVSSSGNTLTIYEEGLGTATITVTATDDGDGNLSVSDAFVVNVANVNDAPVVNNPVENQVLNEYFGTVVIPVGDVFDDKDEDLLSLSVVSSNTDVVTVSLSGNNLTITEQGLGTATITLTASDGSLSEDDQFQVTVNNVNDAPVVDNPVTDKEYLEYFGSATVNLANVFSDKDGDPLTLTAVSDDPSVVTVTVSGNTLTITEVDPGVATVTITADDGAITVDTDFRVTVTNVNDPPEVDNPIGNVSLNEFFGTSTIDLSALFVDPDGDDLTLSVTGSNEDVVLVDISGTTLNVTEVGLGSSTITITASDGVLSEDYLFTIKVDNVNEVPEVITPVADQEVYEYFGTTEIDLSEVFSDPDGDAMTISATSSNEDVVTVSVDEFIVTITEVSFGSSTITITASDGSLSVNDQFLFTVINVNDAPVVINPIPDQSVVQNIDTLEIWLGELFEDPDGDELTVSVSSDPDDITAALVSKMLKVSGTNTGIYEVFVTASDGEYSATDTLTVEVLEEIPLVVMYAAQEMAEGDTIKRCNEAGEFTIGIETTVDWGVGYSIEGWNVVQEVDNSTLSVAYSENLTGEERYFDLTITDEQGHKLNLYVKQTENCDPDAIEDWFSISYRVYPNPAGEFIYIETGSAGYEEVQVQVYDATGRMVYLNEHQGISSVPFSIDVSSYLPGTYFVRISNDGHEYIEKIIKH